ncbi:TPR-like protein [Suillus clintonianus]|uniref:TPR-like protein n=1 Tax=Suillus clintonianus TaxID=1904413 RepID=UPI001B864A4E|nr:TPR-like protein [Suillus clintonianus]KAG2119430.1 TPR-like protein [Suillus clintonianus]
MLPASVLSADKMEECGAVFADKVEEFRAVSQSFPSGHYLRVVFLSALAVSLGERSKRRGIPSDLDEAIELHRALLLLRPTGHPERRMYLCNLAISLGDRFKQGGVPSDLDEAIELDRAALLLSPPGHFLRSGYISNLAIKLGVRFRQQGMLPDLDEAIELHRAALLLPLPSDSYLPGHLGTLATNLQLRFQRQGILSDIDEAIELHKAALLLHPPGDSHRFASLNNLGISIRERFEQRGVVSDIDESIELHRAALLLNPPGHFNRSSSLNHLANSLTERFQQRSILSDFDESIELHQAALLLRPPGHSDRYESLCNVAASLLFRFKQRGIQSDLDEAIKLNRAALLLCPPGHSDHSMVINNLAISLKSRFMQQGVLSDLHEAIELHRTALLLCLPGHPDRSTFLDYLATSLHVRFIQQGVLSDLDEAAEFCRAALLLNPPGHHGRPSSLNGLANILSNRFEQRGVQSDFDEAIELLWAVLLLCPPGHSNRPMYLGNLARTLNYRFKQRGMPADHDEAFKLYLQLSHISHAPSLSDLGVADSWIISAEEANHSSALVAYQTRLKFQDQHVALLSPSLQHFDAVKKVTSLFATGAFSCGLRRGSLKTAVELMEQGRAVFWTQLARFRTPLDELSQSNDTGAALAEKFKRLSLRLRNAFDQSTEDKSPQIRQLTMQWNDVVSRIRMLPDFSRFLLPPLFSELQKAAEEGPVIIVNCSLFYSCDALIIFSAKDPVHVPLDIEWIEVFELSREFQSLTEQFGSSDYQQKLVKILRKLWDCIVEPVVQALRVSNVHPGSRIWWCPTGELTLFPLHAAGPYEAKRDNLSHIYISSYTPTLTTLIRARQQVSRDASPQHFVAIGQGKPDRGKALQCVAPELAVVAQHVAPVAAFTSLSDSHATVQAACDALSQNQWLHLACHGTPNRKQPFESFFAMRDGPLMIKDIIRTHCKNPEFAFLSACHTTVGDEYSPDELIHLAAGIQFCGFRSVIGSMWSVDDDVARQVVSAFYRNLVDGSGRLDCTRAAVALHKAVKSLRKKIPLEQQIVFVHIGV